MIFLKSVVMAFSTFSRLPMPKIEWRDENMKYMLCAFPLIGIAIGLTLWGWTSLCTWMGFGNLLRASGMTIVPVAVTGAIHLDGFCDTVDALSSHADVERKREILKDPHIGAFGTVALCCYLISYVALCAELEVNGEVLIMLGMVHVVSRNLSAFLVVRSDPDERRGMLATFRRALDVRNTSLSLSAFLIVCFIIGLCTCWPIWTTAFIGAVICWIWVSRMAKREFGAISGDISGFFVQICEMCMLALLVLGQKVVII